MKKILFTALFFLITLVGFSLVSQNQAFAANVCNYCNQQFHPNYSLVNNSAGLSSQFNLSIDKYPQVCVRSDLQDAIAPNSCNLSGTDTCDPKGGCMPAGAPGSTSCNKTGQLCQGDSDCRNGSDTTCSSVYCMTTGTIYEVSAGQTGTCSFAAQKPQTPQDAAQGQVCSDFAANSDCPKDHTCLTKPDGTGRCVSLPGENDFCYPYGKGGTNFENPSPAPGKCASVDGKPLNCIPQTTDLPGFGKKTLYVCSKDPGTTTPPCAVSTTTLPNPAELGGKDVSSTTIPLTNCAGVNTAFGFVLSTDAPAAVKDIFAVILSIIGGVAVFRIILAGLQIMTSEGNPDKIKEARESLQSSLIGLVFALLSMVILQTIGVDILQIPGFGK